MKDFLGQFRKLVFLLLTVSSAIFFLLRASGDPAYVIAGMGATPEQLTAVREQYGLNLPLWQQFLVHLRGMLTLNFGDSIATGDPAMSLVLERLPHTLQLALMAMAVSLLIAIPIGTWLGAKPHRPLRRFASGLVFVLQGSPGFVLALLLIQLFAVELLWLPSVGYDARNSSTWVLPTISLAMFSAPSLIRVLAANIVETLQEDYARTALAFGAPARTVLWRHVLPNALLGVAALAGVQFAGLLSGSAVIETIFGWPGLGSLLLESVSSLDFPVVQAEVFVIALLVFMVNACTDIMFKLLDPRLREHS